MVAIATYYFSHVLLKIEQSKRISIVLPSHPTRVIKIMSIISICKGSFVFAAFRSYLSSRWLEICECVIAKALYKIEIGRICMQYNLTDIWLTVSMTGNSTRWAYIINWYANDWSMQKLISSHVSLLNYIYYDIFIEQNPKCIRS